MWNSTKTVLLLGAMTALILALGEYFGGRQGLLLAFAFAAIMNLGSYWFSDKIVLAMHGAREVGPEEAPQLHAAVANLAQSVGLPMPRVYRVPSEGANAFATGRNPQHAAVAVTDGLLRILDRPQLEGVLAHELGHIHNRDILISAIAATLAGVIMMLARMAQWAAIIGTGRADSDRRGGGLELLVVALVAPIAALLIQMAISRSREYLADDFAARSTGNPEGLAQALERLGAASRRLPMQTSPATSHLYIVAPFLGGVGRLFSTHPPIEERIARLRAMRGGG
ncbi:MAG TPA: zinc metalloprotease HtpX [Acidobacteriota bacterium]